MRFTNAMATYLEVCKVSSKLSGHTLRAYEKDLDIFLDTFGKQIDIEDVTKQNLEDFVFSLSRQGHKQTSIKRRLASMRAFYKWLEVKELIDINPFNKLAIKLKTPYQLPKNVPRSELAKMLKVARKQLNIKNREDYQELNNIGQLPTRDWAKLNVLVTLEILISTGIRVGELTSIQINQLHIADGRIRIFGKGQRERFVFIPDKAAIQLIKCYIKFRDSKSPEHDFVLINSRGKPASTQYIRKLVKELAKQANISRNVTPHMYRHSAACELLEAGTDIRYVQRLLDHHSISTTQLYTHVNDKVLKEQIVSANVIGGI